MNNNLNKSFLLLPVFNNFWSFLWVWLGFNERYLKISNFKLFIFKKLIKKYTHIYSYIIYKCIFSELRMTKNIYFILLK